MLPMGATRRIGLIVLLALAAVACRPELEIFLRTTVRYDGSLERVLEISGRTDDGEQPETWEWLAEEAGIALADPDAWDRVEDEPGFLRAEGFFLSAAEVPPTLLHLDGPAPAADRNRVEVEVRDLVILTRWTFIEYYGDPYGDEDVELALDEVVQLFREALHSELWTAYGDRVDPSRLEPLLQGELRSLGKELLDAVREHPGTDREDRRTEAWAAIAGEYGIEAPPPGTEEFDEVFIWALFDWLGRRASEAVSTETLTVDPRDLPYWPTGPSEQDDEAASRFVARVWGSDEEFMKRIEPIWEALRGYYGGADAYYRFRPTVLLPGTLLRTSGASGPDGVSWFFREVDLTLEEQVMQAESVELNDESLRSLGARREFDTSELLQMVDILVRRDEEGDLRAVLDESVREADLDLLRTREFESEEISRLAVELADLLGVPEGNERVR